MKQSYILILLFLLFGQNTIAQKYFGVNGEVFGKTVLQKKRFDWKTIKSGNFEFNFYRGGEDIARKSLIKAEQDYFKITEILGYTPFTVMKVYIYNSEADISQSNLEIPTDRDEELKLNNFSKSRILLAYTKNDSLFQNKLITEIATLFVQDMLYGGSFKETVQSQIFLTVPDWYISGIAVFIASQNQLVDNTQFKEAIIRNANKKLSNITGSEAQLIGHSIWKYIAVRYGKDNISNILNLTRIIRNEQSSITSTLGVSYNKFLKEWKDYYVNGSNYEKPNTVVNEIKPSDSSENKPFFNNLGINEIDTDAYKFNDQSLEKFKLQANIETQSAENKPSLSLSTKKSAKSDDVKISSVKSYSNFLTTNGFQLGVLFDPVRGFCVNSSITYKDLLGNNVLKFNAYTKPSSPLFKSYDLDISYGNYTNKIDYLFKYNKRSYNIDGIDDRNEFLFRPLNIVRQEDKTIQQQRRIISQKFSVDIVYPIIKGLRAEFSPAFLRTTDIEYELPGRGNINSNFLNPNFHLVYDNSKPLNNYLDIGSKAKVSLEKYISFSDQKQNFNRFNIDIRHYQKLLKGLILAARVNYTTSYGAAPKFSILGGTENWVNRTIYDARGLLPGKEGDFRDILFYNFPGQLRGFEAVKLFGNSHLLSNIELRTLVAEYLPASAVSSSFLSNLQLVAFYDIGTAWKGKKGPFSRQNSLNTILLGSDGISPFFAEVTNFRSPFISGTGLGLRSSILGYFVKLDYAVGMENKVFNKPMTHISIGRDF